MQRLSPLDLIIFIGYFVAVSLIGFYVGRKQKDSARDYFVTSGRLPWYLIAFGMVASSISTEQFIGAAGASYQWGLVVFNWEWANWPAMLVLLWIFLPVYLNKKIVTMPGYLEQRFGPGPRNLYAAITILAALFIILPGVIYTGGFLLNQMFGINIWFAIVLMSLVGGAFTIYGGLISVAWTQLLQAVLLLVSGILIFVLAITKIPGGFSGIFFAAENARNHLILPASHPELPWTSILVLAISTNIWYFCTAQYIVQSTLGAKTRWDGKMGIILVGFLMLITGISCEFPGLIAYTLNRNLEKPDMAYPFVVKELVGSGLRGLVLAGLTSAVMSTIEALVHSSSAIFTMDFYTKIRKTASQSEIVRVGQITTAAVLVIGTACAPIVTRFDNIFSFFQKCWFFVAGPVAVVFILAILWRKMTNAAAFWTLMLVFPLFLLPHVLVEIRNRFGWHINEYNFAGIFFVISFLFAVFISFVTKPPAPSQIEGLVWRPSMMKLPADELAAGYPWYKNLWLWCFLWVAVMLAVYIKLW